MAIAVEKEQLEVKEMNAFASKEEVIEQIEKVLCVKFSEEQLRAIIHNGTPLNILSCAGSGKTTTLIGKMLFMEMYYDISPAKILAITFNKEAITDMETRYYKARTKLGLNKRLKITFKTYHALYYLILNSKFTDCTWNQIGGYTKYLKQLEASIRDNFQEYDDDTLETIMSIRGFQVNNLLSVEELKKTTKFLVSGIEYEGYAAVIAEYTKLKLKDNRIDFDDLQLLMYDEIKNNPKVLEVIHNAWEYIVVDEYQDISKVQLEILKLMVKDHNKLTAIGDDDQSIYEFRGSRTEYIVDFSVHFKNAERIIMSTNYRVPKTILNPVTNSINHNSKRVSKSIKSFEEGGTLHYTNTEGSYDSAIKIADAIKEIRDGGGDLSDVVILLRNNSQQRIILDYLLHSDIPTSTQSGFTLSGHMVVRDIKDIINMALNDKDYYFFNRGYRKIMQYVTYNQAKFVQDRMQHEEKSWREIMLNSTTNASVHESSSMLYQVEEMVKNHESLEKIINVIQPLYREYLKYRVNKFGMNAYELGDVLKYMKLLGKDMTYEKFYKELGRKESLKRFFETNSEDAVRISTMHKMKGLEYKYVFLLDLTEDVLPNAKIEEDIVDQYGQKYADEYIEQERRLFYVAWTRAKIYLNVLVNNRNPSRFILETLESDSASNKELDVENG